MVPQAPEGGFVVFTSEALEPKGSIIALDENGRERARESLGLQDVPHVATDGRNLILWGDLSNDLGIVGRDGSVRLAHSLDRRGYGGFTSLRVDHGRISGTMNQGFTGPDGLYQVVFIAQDLDGGNAQKLIVDIDVRGIEADGEDFIFTGSLDDGRNAQSVLTRFSPAQGRVVSQIPDARYVECSMLTRSGDSLIEACLGKELPGFETVVRRIDIETLREIDVVRFNEPVRALTVSPTGELLAAVGDNIVQLDANLNTVRSVPVVDPVGDLSLQDLVSAYVIEDSWHLILKAPRLDIGDAATHVATLVTVRLAGPLAPAVLPIRLDRTQRMGSVAPVPAAWFGGHEPRR